MRDSGELVQLYSCRSLLRVAGQSRPNAGLRMFAGSFSAVTDKAAMNYLRSVQKRSRLSADQAHVPEHNICVLHAAGNDSRAPQLLPVVQLHVCLCAHCVAPLEPDSLG